MINVRVRAFHMDRLPKCQHGRALCKFCGLDPFDHSPPQQLLRERADADGARGRINLFHGSAVK